MDAGSFPVPMLVRWLLAGVVFFGVATSACRYGSDILRFTSTNGVRATDHTASTQWAEPMQMDGVPNLHKVSDGLYRGAQPTAAGIKDLKRLGVRTIINLRETDSDKGGLRGTSFAYERIPMTAFFPKDEDVVQFLRIVGDGSHTPVFVHCKRGADRTGLMCAIYRIAVQGWTKEQALDEMTRGGFGFNQGYQNVVRYIRALDIDELKLQAGLTRGSEAAPLQSQVLQLTR